MKRLIWLALLALAACDDDDRVWRNGQPGHSTQAYWDKDRYECTRENTQTTGAVMLPGGLVYGTQSTDTTMLEACMLARGWQVAGTKR